MVDLSKEIDVLVKVPEIWALLFSKRSQMVNWLQRLLGLDTINY